jgi:hypothetical protein
LIGTRSSTPPMPSGGTAEKERTDADIKCFGMHSGQARSIGFGICPRGQHLELYSKLSRCLLCLGHLGIWRSWGFEPDD